VNFSDLFEGFFGGSTAGARRRSGKGEDKEVTIEIDFADAVQGARHVIRVRKLRTCDKCAGTGAEPGSNVRTCGECGGTGQVTRTMQSFFGAMQQRILCPRCHGSGKVPEKACGKCSGEGRFADTVDVTVDVPAGIDDGQTLRLRGEGDAGRQGEAAGDLYVHIRLRRDPRFERDGADIRSTQKISVLDAILGSSVSIETVQGPVTLAIPPGTQPSQVFRIKGKGLPVLSTNRHGEHYVTIEVEVPTKLSREEKKILEEWKSLK
jgi:molecular chaperone DnaJ